MTLPEPALPPEEPTLGAMLRELRDATGASLDELAEATRIQKKYLEALEIGRDKDLPDPSYVRHFLRAIAGALNVSAEPLLARYHPPSDEPPLTTPPVPPSPLAFLVPSRLLGRIGIVALVAVILLLLALQVRSIFTLPELIVDAPTDAQLLTSSVTAVVGSVRGRGAEVRVNGDLVYPDDQGNFRLDVDLQQGVNLIKIAAKKPHSAERVLYRQVVVRTTASSSPEANPPSAETATSTPR